ncbi:hypothetical protein [Saccharopolyspora tripterygii]
MARGRQDPDDWDVEYDPTAEMDNAWGAKESASESTLKASSGEPPVTVEVDDAGFVTSASLAADWKKSVDPRTLHTTVLTAVQTASMQVLVSKAEQVDSTSTPVDLTASAPADLPDTSPLSAGDVQRLLDEVYADVDRFTEQASNRLNKTVSVTSSGGHVTAAATKGQVHDLSIEPSWSSAARNAEIESELNEVFRRLSEQGSPGDLADGPQSRAISELKSLVSDPQLFLRRIGLPPQP